MKNCIYKGAVTGLIRPSHPVVALLIYDGIGPFHIAGPLLVFGYSGFGHAYVDIDMCALTAGTVRTLAGFEIHAAHDLRRLEHADVIVVPGWHDVDAPVPAALAAALRKAHARGAQIIGLCLGVFVLAEAGLLGGRQATTHWARSADFALRYPQIRLMPDMLYVRDGQVWTAAGGASAIDVCLLLLKELCGLAVATEVAQRIVSAPQRHGGQQQLIERPLPAGKADGKMQELLNWASEHPQERPSIKELAERAHMSVRSFTRHFRRITGTTFVQWQLHQRLLLAQRLLRSTSHTVEQIAAQTGFPTSTSLRQHFRLQYGLTPRQYRAGASRATLPSELDEHGSRAA